MRKLFSRNRTVPRLRWLVVALAITAGGVWWWSGREPHGPEADGPAVSTPAQPPAGPLAAEPPPSLSERLGDALQPENAPTTEADPPHVKDGVSRGHALGLQRTRDPLHLKASAAFVMDPRDGAVLFHKNEDAVLPIASVTKLMTALVLMEARLPMDQVITITDDDVDRERHSRSRLRVGTALTRREALHLALMSSENRAAHALGRTFPGGLAAFVAAMNRKAHALGMKSTVYVDPTGLSARNLSTARDLAAIVTAASKEPMIREFSTTAEHEAKLGQRQLMFHNSDRLVKSSRWRIHLQKTGYIVEAGHCLVINGTVGDRELILVLLDSPDRRSHIDDAERIRRWTSGEPPRASLREKVRKLKRRLTGAAAKHKAS